MCPWTEWDRDWLLNVTGLVNWLFNVTINDISVIHVTALRCAGGLRKKLDLRSGSQRHRHFVWFFNVPVQTPTRGHPFYTVIPTHRPIKSPIKTRWGYGVRTLELNPRRPHGSHATIFLLYMWRHIDTQGDWGSWCTYACPFDYTAFGVSGNVGIP